MSVPINYATNYTERTKGALCSLPLSPLSFPIEKPLFHPSITPLQICSTVNWNVV